MHVCLTRGPADEVEEVEVQPLRREMELGGVPVGGLEVRACVRHGRVPSRNFDEPGWKFCV